jgi:hypothetical protein
MAGPPVWLILVGPPSCGKSQVLDPLAGMNEMLDACGEITYAGLLPLKKTRKGNKGVVQTGSGGVLGKIGRYGVLVISDFSTTVLSMQHEQMAKVIGAFRQIYMGNFSRNADPDGGGRSVSWEGKMGMLAGCTPNIDSHHSVMGGMGERFVFYRYPVTGYSEAYASLDMSEPKKVREYLQCCFENYFDSMSGVEKIAEDAAQIKLQMMEKDKLVAVAQLAAKCRGSVTRNRYSRDVEEVPYSEGPSRLVKVLGLMLRSLMACGVRKKEAWRLTARMALDSMPLTRRRAMVCLGGVNGDGGLDLEEGVKRSGVHSTTLRRAMEDLVLLGVVRDEVEGKKKVWRMREQDLKRWKTGFSRVEGRFQMQV